MTAYTYNTIFKENVIHQLDDQGITLCGRGKVWYGTEPKPAFHFVQRPRCAEIKEKPVSVTKPKDVPASGKPEFRNAGGRPRKYSSSADRQRAYRQRQKKGLDR